MSLKKEVDFMSGYENVKLAGITFKEMDGQKLSMIFGVG